MKETSAARDLALPLVVALGFAAVATWMRFAADDALIKLRWAENLAAGYGPVFNPGEYVHHPFYAKVGLQLAHVSPERRACSYERVTELPGLGKINAYRRRDWMP
jgi:hypothetical protein